LIQEAVDNPIITEIILKKGTWIENVEIDRSIDITGSHSGQSIVDGGFIESVFTIDADAVVNPFIFDYPEWIFFFR
jgi:hypothetical protein